MYRQKQKNYISYQLYTSKKNKEPDHLCNVINKYKYLQKVESVNTDAKDEQTIRRKLNQKRIQQIKRIRKCNKVSKPQAYIKRTWISPLKAHQNNEQVAYCVWKKISQKFNKGYETELQKARKVYSILNLNKKMHLFGEFMYCQFQGKQNNKVQKLKIKQKKMDLMHKQYSKLMSSIKKNIVICNKNSILNKKIQINPLQQDKYYIKIIRHNDQQLSRLLVQTLSISGNFTFSSYIQFYQIFVWQQAARQTQIQFVIRLLMGTSQQILYSKLSQVIDFICNKINLSEHKQSLNGFNQVMKKLIFGIDYQKCQSSDYSMIRSMLVQSLEVNQQCISIFINVFYSQ